MLCKCSGKYIDIYFNLKITCSVFQAESIDVLKSSTIEYQIKEDCHHIASQCYYPIVEHFITKLKVLYIYFFHIIVKLK